MSLLANVQAVLFDLDGTLIDSAPDLGAAADKMRTARTLPSLPSDSSRPGMCDAPDISTTSPGGPACR